MDVDHNSFSRLTNIDWVPVGREFAHPVDTVVLNGVLCPTGPLILVVIDELAVELRLFQGQAIALIVQLVWHSVIPLHIADSQELAAVIRLSSALILRLIFDQGISLLRLLELVLLYSDHLF